MSTWGMEEQHYYLPRSQRAGIKLEPFKYGSTTLGSPLNVYLPSSWGRTRTLVMAGIHGEESDGVNILSYAMRSLQPAALRCAVILGANPDGLVHGTRGNAHNVDLNRNLPTSNWREDLTMTRWETELPKDVELSSGNKPASEIETSSLIKFIQKNGVRQIASIHSPLSCIDYEQPIAWPLIEELGDRLQLPIVNDIGYPCPGSLGTWAAENNIKIVTIEIEEGLPLSHLRRKYGPVFQDLLLAKLAGI